MLIDIGAGDRPYEDGRGWTHVDTRPLEDIEVVCDALELHRHFEPNSADEIRATHLLEHFPYGQTVSVLENWQCFLRPGGILYLEVPNFGWQCRALAGGHDEDEIVHLCFGGQNYPGNFHQAGFTEGILRRRLEEASYTGIITRDIGMVICATARKLRL